MYLKRLFLISFVSLFFAANLFAQKQGFVSSDLVREYFPEAKQAEQRLQSMVDEWKRELATMQTNVENLEFEIDKNRLIWSDGERMKKEEELKELKIAREAYAKAKFEPGGLYEETVQRIIRPVEQKIYAAVQKVANDNNYDFVFDQSIQPLTYVNYKYDLTVKVLKELGVPAAELEAELEKKIKEDPRNQTDRTRKPTRTSRGRGDTRRSIDRTNPDEEPPMEEEINPEEEENPRKINRRRR